MLLADFMAVLFATSCSPGDGDGGHVIYTPSMGDAIIHHRLPDLSVFIETWGRHARKVHQEAQDIYSYIRTRKLRFRSTQIPRATNVVMGTCRCRRIWESYESTKIDLEEHYLEDNLQIWGACLLFRSLGEENPML